MAYLRDDQKMHRYQALLAETMIVDKDIAALLEHFALESMKLFRLKHSLEQRMDELKQDCHLLQR